MGLILSHEYRLSVPPEPVDIKAKIKTLSSALGPGEEGDNLAVWTGNMLARYLWSHWGETLRHEGVSWQMFMSMLKEATGFIVQWALWDAIAWDELVKRIIETLERKRKSDLTRFLAGLS